MAARNLVKDGVVVIPFQDMHAHVAAILGSITEVKDLKHQIEILDHKIDDVCPQTLVVGAFGAMGLPSTSHSPAARNLREIVYRKMYPMFAEMFPGRKLEMLFDRFGIRREGSDPTVEDWHRDEGPRSPGDVVYGGFLNLNASEPDRHGQIRSQFFTCVPGDVLPPVKEGEEDKGGKGFNRFGLAEKDDLERKQVKFEVLPGQFIVFNQTIAHKITKRTTQTSKRDARGVIVRNKQGNVEYVSVPAPATSYRQYFGWRITDMESPYISKADVINTQSPPPLPSGQPSTMYADLHWVNHLNTILIPFSNSFKDNKNFFEYKPREADGVTYYIIKHVLGGLVPMGRDFAFTPYSLREISIMLPRILTEGGIYDNNEELRLSDVRGRLEIGLHKYLPGKEPKELSAKDIKKRKTSIIRLAQLKGTIFENIPRKRLAKQKFPKHYEKTDAEQTEFDRIRAYNEKCADEDAIRTEMEAPVYPAVPPAQPRGAFKYPDDESPAARPMARIPASVHQSVKAVPLAQPKRAFTYPSNVSPLAVPAVRPIPAPLLRVVAQPDAAQAQKRVAGQDPWVKKNNPNDVQDFNIQFENVRGIKTKTPANAQFDSDDEPIVRRKDEPNVRREAARKTQANAELDSDDDPIVGRKKTAVVQKPAIFDGSESESHISVSSDDDKSIINQPAARNSGAVAARIINSTGQGGAAGKPENDDGVSSSSTGIPNGNESSSESDQIQADEKRDEQAADDPMETDYTEKELEIIQMYKDQRLRDTDFVDDQREKYRDYADKIEDVKVTRYAIMFGWDIDATRFDRIRDKLENGEQLNEPSGTHGHEDDDGNSQDEYLYNAVQREERRESREEMTEGTDSDGHESESEKEQQNTDEIE